MSDVFAKVKDGDVAISSVPNEAPIGQNISVFVDPSLQDVAFIENLGNAEDLFAECPVSGTVNLEKEIGGTSIRKSLVDSPELAEDLIAITPSGGSGNIEEIGGDHFTVDSSGWIDQSDPAEQLAWRSALLAELKAKLNATKQYRDDASDFGNLKDVSVRKAIAAYARELAEELQLEALNEIRQNNENAESVRRKKIKESKEHFQRYITTDGFTKAHLNELYKGGE